MISLIRVQMLTSFGINRLKKGGKRGRAIALGLLVALGVAPSYVGYIVMLSKVYAFLSANNLPLYDTVLTAIYSLAQMMILLSGLPIVYATLFRSKDLSILLPLPFRPRQILAAKLFTTYAAELLISVLFFLPALVLNAIYAHPGPGVLLNGVVSMLLLPLTPICISALMVLAVLNIPRIGRCKWFWHLASMVCFMAAWFSFVAFSPPGSQPDVRDLVQAKMHQVAQLGRLVPGSVFALKTLAVGGLGGLLNQAANVAAIGAWLLALFAAAERFYIRPVLIGDDGGRRHRRAETSRARSFLLSYVRKELTTTFKDPAVAMNAAGGYIALPLMAVVYTVMKVQSKGKVDVIGALAGFAHGSQIARHVPLVVVGFGLGVSFLGAASSIFSASYSKDGQRLWIEKSLPVRPFEIFRAKLVAGLVALSGLNLLTIAAAGLVVPLKFGHLAYAFVLSETVIAYSGAAGLLIDGLRPKLTWKDTVQAVKNNMNVMLAFAATGAALAANAVVLWRCHTWGASPFVIYTVVLAGNAALLAVVLAGARKWSQGLDDVVV